MVIIIIITIIIINGIKQQEGKNTHLQTFHFIQLHQILPTGGAQEIIVKIHLYIPEVQISDFAIEMPNEFHELYGDYTISFGNEDE
jgi:hypothetical protein